MDDQRIELTQDIVDEIRQHKKRTQVGSTKLLKIFLDDAPQSLNRSIIEHVSRFKKKTVRKKHLDFILTSYRSLPDNNDVMIELTPELVKEIKYHRERTGIGSTRLLNIFSDDVPKDLKYYMIDNILEFKQKTVRKTHLSFLQNSYHSLPENEVVTINQDELAQQINRTGLGINALEKHLQGKMPDDATIHTFKNIVNRQVKTAKKHHIDFLLSVYKSFPDNYRCMIGDKTIDEIKSHIQRTGLGVQALLKGKRHRIPKGLTAAKIQAALLNSARRVKREYIEFILNEYRTLPDWSDIYMENTAHIRNELKSLVNATGLPLARIFKSRDDLPDGLTIISYASWFKKTNPARGIKREHYTYLINLFKSLAE